MRQINGKHALTEALEAGSLTQVVVPQKMQKRYKEIIGKANQ